MGKRILSLLLAVVMICAMLPQISISVDATASPITTNTELVSRAVDVATNYKTLYVMAGWGQPLTASNKQRLINQDAYNQDATRQAMINAATADTFAFDCVCFIKGLLWGWDGTLTATNGGAEYGSNGVADVNADGMINLCQEISTDFSDIEVGEVVWTNGHVGLYIGDGKVVESTPYWKNGVQITGITGYQNWKKHGKLPYIEYNTLIEDSYPAYCAIKVTADTTYIKSLPCSESSDANSTNVEVASKNDQYQAIGLVENKYGNLWYKVQTKSGTTGYMYAGDTTYVGHTVSDIKGTGITVPTNHTAGKIYVLTGTVSATYNQLTGVSAYVYAGTSEQGTKETGASASVSGNSYSLGGSSIDSQTEFNKLPVGTHTYVVWASYKNYYATSGTTYKINTNTIGVYKSTFNVVSGSSTHTCDKGTYLYFEAVHPHRDCYKCSVCGNVWAVDGTSNYYSSCSECKCSHSYTSAVTKAATCATSGVRTYTCSKCGDSYTEAIAATGNHSYSSSVTKAATCGSSGVRTYTCRTCSRSYTETIPATGNHSYGAWVNLVDGTERRYCNNCSHYESRDIEQYSISFDGQGGYSVPQEALVTKGNTYTIPNQIALKFGYNFNGWLYEGQHYYPGDVITPSKGMRFVADWDEPYTFRFNSGANSTEIVCPQMTYHGYGFWYRITVPQHGNYVFVGLNDSSMDTKVELYDAAGNLIGSDDDSGGNRQFFLKAYGLYKDDNYLVYVRPYSSSTRGEMKWYVTRTNPVFYSVWDSTSDYVYADSHIENFYRGKLTTDIPEKDGYIFLGWSKEENAAEPMYQPGEEVELVVLDGITDYLMLYPVWGKSSGVDGKITWTIDGNTLILSGTGDMSDYSYDIMVPWYSCREQIEAVVIEAGISSIGSSAFYNHTNLVNIDIPDDVRRIGVAAFAFCDSLREIILPENLKELGEAAFNFCENLQYVTLPQGITTIDMFTFSNCPQLSDVVIPDGVVTIGQYAFQSCESMTSITIPGSVRAIKGGAFYGCNQLEYVYYQGSQKQWNEVNIATNNECLTSAQIYFIQPIVEGSFAGVHDAYCDSTWATLEANGTGLRVDTNPENEDDNGLAYPQAYEAVLTINGVLGLPSSLDTQMGNTTGADGTQSESFPALGISVSWSYHPDLGLEVVYTLLNGWYQDGGKWCYYENGTMVKNAWRKDSKGWCYLQADGTMATNKWLRDSKGWCYVETNGYCATNCWKKDSIGWIYLDANGSMTKSKWIKDAGKWYFLDANGYMVTNKWSKDSVGWVYCGNDGAMLTNAWCKDSKGWCYVGADGYAVTNCWKKDSTGWIYLDANGSMSYNKWIQDGSSWYYVDSTGYMVANRSMKIGGKTYNFNASGVCTNP